MATKFITETKRTHSCGALRRTDEGAEVVLFGWVQHRRDHGQVIFVDLRDREGLTQVVFDPEVGPEAHRLAENFRSEWVIGIRGRVRVRGQQRSRTGELVSAANPKLATGDIEVYATEAIVFNKAQTPPFEVSDSVAVNEEKRLAYRYIDLRRPSLQLALRQRSQIASVTRKVLNEEGFLEVETPFMGRYTPGGARNFLVPSRLNPGRFYALAESPQLYKQLLMVAGFDRYFQIVKCFRDEDLRLDRQPEFTQIDLEMSFVSQEDIFAVIEKLIARTWKEVLGIDIPLPLPRLDFAESMAKYGNDKPDLRFGLPHVVLNDVIRPFLSTPEVDPRIREALEAGGLMKAIRVPKEYTLSRKDVDDLETLATGMGASGLARAKVGEAQAWTGAPLFKTSGAAMKRAIEEATGAQPQDLLLFQFGPASRVHTVLANLRVALAKRLGLIPETGACGKWSFLWVVNPPLFEFDDASKTWVCAHHAFTRPHDDCLPYLEPDSFQPERVLCHRYDIVLNGFEIGGGSIRLHDPEVQAKVFRAIGIGEEEAASKFGFLLDALKYGAPPHGGIALGMDRIAFLLSEVESLRDVVAFPKTQRGSDLMTGAPGEVTPRQLDELSLRLRTPS